MSIRNLRRYRLWLALGLCILGGLIAAVFNDTIASTLLSPGQMTGPQTLLLAGLISLWFLASQIVLAPSGTISIILSALLLGPVVGLLYFLAMIGATLAVYTLASLNPGETNRLIRKLTRNRRQAAWGRWLLQRGRTAPISTTAALRLVPVLPSAGCALVMSALGVRLRPILLGTLATGWIRPVAFAVFSVQIQAALNADSGLTSSLLVNPALWISLFCLLAPALILRLALKKSGARA